MRVVLEERSRGSVQILGWRMDRGGWCIERVARRCRGSSRRKESHVWRRDYETKY